MGTYRDFLLDRSLVRHFADLDDPRCELKRRHKLIDMIVIAIAAMLCGADGWVGIAAFGRAKRDWLGQFLELPNGIPAHDTFGWVFALIEPSAFEACFRTWVEAIREVIPGEVIAVDGKTLRRSHDRRAGLGRCIGSVPGRAATGWSWDKWPPRRNPTRSPPSRACSSCCRFRAASSRSMPWAAR